MEQLNYNKSLQMGGSTEKVNIKHSEVKIERNGNAA
jgi:hypothetical protein